MTGETQKLEIAKETIEPFVLCLALGTLEAMKSEIWILEAGIWTIRRPIFFEKLRELGVSQNVINELGLFDELSGLEKSAGRNTAIKEIERIEDALKQHLRLHPDNFWYAGWSKNEL